MMTRAMPSMVRRAEVSRFQRVFSLRQELGQALDLVPVPIESLGEIDAGAGQTYADPVFTQPSALVEIGVGLPRLSLVGSHRR